MKSRTRSVLAIVLVAIAIATDAQAATLKDIVKRNELVMCAQADALPFSRQGGDIEGFQIELGRAVAAGLGVPLHVHFMRLHREPRRGECDVLMTVAVQATAEADASYRTTRAYMSYRPVFVVRQSRTSVASIDALAPGKVAVQSGSWAHFMMTQRSIPVWVRFRTDEEIIGAVVDGDADGGIVSGFALGWYLKNHPGAPIRHAAELPLEGDLGYDIAIGIMDNDQRLVDRIDAILDDLAERGFIASTLRGYGIELQPPRRASGVPE